MIGSASLLALWISLVFLRTTTTSKSSSSSSSNSSTATTAVPTPPALQPLHYFNVSVVVMNHNRPRMIRESQLMKTLTAHAAVTEIRLCHSNPATKFDFVHPKVTNIDATKANRELGLSLRFDYCQTAANPWVLHVDDDMELSAAAVDALLEEFAPDTQRIVGHYGRNYNFVRAPYRNGCVYIYIYPYYTIQILSIDTLDTRLHSIGCYTRLDAPLSHRACAILFLFFVAFYRYDTRTVAGPAEVVLTKIMVMERELCRAFFRHAHLVNDLLPRSTPLWNGEDIFMSLVANHEYNLVRSATRSSTSGTSTSTSTTGPYRNYAIADLDVWEAGEQYKDDTTGALDVSGNVDQHGIWKDGFGPWWRAVVKSQKHAAYRGKLWYTAKQRLAALQVDALSE